MARPEQNQGGTDSEEALEHTLTALGPLLRQRAEVKALDPAFARRLRAQLAPDNSAVDTAPSPHLAMDAAPSHPPGAISRASVRRRPAIRAVAGLVAALIVAASLVVVALAGGHRSSPSPSISIAWQPPHPSVGDLTRGYPAPSAGAPGAIAPTMSLAVPPHGMGYGGRVSLRMVPVPARAFQLQAFRLVASATVVSSQRLARMARRLGLRAPVRRLAQGRAPWIVAAVGSPGHHTLHSVAASLVTGEIVYHDAAYPQLTRHERWRDNPSVVAVARRWLTGVGWPGAQMPLTEIEHSGIPAGLREIEFGWAGVGAAASDAATLWVTPSGQVVEADLWPPVESIRTLPAGTITGAWTAIRGGLVPLAVEGVPPHTRAPGTGVMRRVTISQVLSTGSDHRLYLVPTYHVTGTARLRGLHGQYICYALAPAD